MIVFKVYDEKCDTHYQRHCKSNTNCVMVYQTVCKNSYNGYQQECVNQVSSTKEISKKEIKNFLSNSHVNIVIQKQFVTKLPKLNVIQ